MVATTGTAFLGLTVGCVRCHSHKFDPISHGEYYSMAAMFAGVQHGDRALPMPPEQKVRLEALETRVRELEARMQRFLAKPAVAKVGTSVVGRVRPAVQARINEEVIQPIEARLVRFTIEATSGGEPCIDEIEVWSGDRNVALASAGTKATASGTLPGYEIHKLEHVNDGKAGNPRSWISNESGKGWVQLDLAKSAKIDRIVWGRDRDGNFGDLMPWLRHRGRVRDRWNAVDDGGLVGGPGGVQGRDDEAVGSGLCVRRFAGGGGGGGTWLAGGLGEGEEGKGRGGPRAQCLCGELRKAGGDPAVPPRRSDATAGSGGAGDAGDLPAVDAVDEHARAGASGTIGGLDREPGESADGAGDGEPRVAGIFGEGIVRTPRTSGKMGERPTHPELLDWLAAEFMKPGGAGAGGDKAARPWSIKHLHRLILTSATWRQSSRPRAEALRVDGATTLGSNPSAMQASGL